MLCKHFGSCGGCSIQDKDYEVQLKEKEAFVFDLFKPFINTDTDSINISGCKDPWRYRNKMEFSFGELRDGSKNIGLYKKRGIVTKIEQCLITPLWFEEVLTKAHAWWENETIRSYYPPRDRGTLRTLTLREPNMVILTVSGNEEFKISQEAIDRFVAIMPHHLSIVLREQILKKKEPTRFVEYLLRGQDHISQSLNLDNESLKFNISPQAFFQPNTKQAEIIYKKALDHANIGPHDTVFDLYSGTGTLGMFAAKRAKKVISIELSSESVKSAKENVCLNNISNLEIYEGDVGKILMSINESADVIMVDPPRCGLDEKAIVNILEKKPKKILYISCNPITQVQNVAKFIDAGFKLKKLQPIDQFPHTQHIENIAVLS
jgi:23S rRNA (uracil1939-C5)-methyltransferase